MDASFCVADISQERSALQAINGSLPAHESMLVTELRILLDKLSGQCIVSTLINDINGSLEDISRNLADSAAYIRAFRHDPPENTFVNTAEERLASYLGFARDDESWNVLYGRQKDMHNILMRLKEFLKSDRLNLLNKSLGLRLKIPQIAAWTDHCKDGFEYKRNGESLEEHKMMKWLGDVIPSFSRCIEILTSQDFFSMLWEHLFEQGKRLTDSSDFLTGSTGQPENQSELSEPHLTSLKREDIAVMEDLNMGQNFQNMLKQHETFDMTRIKELPYEIQWKIKQYVEFNRIKSQDISSRKTKLHVVSSPFVKNEISIATLPFDVWRRILHYIEDDDSALFSLLEASNEFRPLLRDEIRDRIAQPQYWRDALIKRGVNVRSYLSAVTCTKKDVEAWDDGLWYERYKSYVKTLACFRCFSRLSKSASGKPIVTHRFHRRIAVEATRLARGQAAVLNDGPAREVPEKWKDVDLQVLGVQFCDWDVSKSPAQQIFFNNLVVTLLGPPCSPYAGGRFQLHIHFPEAFPFEPPQARMLTKILSPYFTDHGDFYYKFNSVCGGGTNPSLPTYREYWLLIYEIGYIVNIVARYLTFTDLDKDHGETPAQLIVVNAKHNELMEKNRAGFAALARKCTSDYAMAHWNVHSNHSNGFASDSLWPVL